MCDISRLNARSGYMPQLDTLRALAIFTVLLQHWLPAGHPLRILSTWGALGVYLFFVLSGFLITDILLRGKDAIDSGQASAGWVLRQFYIRRFLRIFPIYYLALLVGCALDLPQMRDAWAWHAAYLSNFWLANLPADVNPGPAGGFWTLAIEEQFYLIWPLLILMIPRRWMFPSITLITLSSPVMSYFAYSNHRWNFTYMTPFAFQYFGAGALLATARWPDSPVGEKTLRRLFWIVGIAAVLAVAMIGKPVQTWEKWAVLLGRPMSLAIIFAALVGTCAAGVAGWAGRIIELPPLRYVGKISYGIYVYHMMVLAVVPMMLLAVGLWNESTLQLSRNFFIRLGVVLLVAAASWRWIEAPINAFKRHFPALPPKSRSPDSVSVIDAGYSPTKSAEAAGAK